MSFEGLSYMLLRIVGVNDQQLLQLLAPFNGTFPQTQQQYSAMIGSMRRMGHILENQPGNIASSLRSRGDTAPALWRWFGHFHVANSTVEIE